MPRWFFAKKLPTPLGLLRRWGMSSFYPSDRVGFLESKLQSKSILSSHLSCRLLTQVAANFFQWTSFHVLHILGWVPVFFFCLTKYFIVVKYTQRKIYHLIPFKVYSLVVLSKFSWLLSHHHHPSPELSSSSQTETLCPWNKNPLFCPPPTTIPLAISINLTAPGASCELNHMVICALWLAHFI